jgi:hypothetical protein
VLTHDADFGTLAVHRGEPLTGIVYLRPGGRPLAQVIADVQALMDAEIDWTPSVIAEYRAGRLRLRRLSEGHTRDAALFLRWSVQSWGDCTCGEWHDGVDGRLS